MADLASSPPDPPSSALSGEGVGGGDGNDVRAWQIRQWRGGSGSVREADPAAVAAPMGSVGFFLF